MNENDLKNEWALLQNQFDSYEKYSLIIKLVNCGVFFITVLLSSTPIFVALLLMALWGQDAIWKTFQSRIEKRLLLIEKSLLDGIEERAYQFNNQYQKNRPGVLGLIGEYFGQALRPTIAFPHALLVLLLVLDLLFSFT